MKIGIIIPDRSDRPKFLENCLRMLENQTVAAEIVELVNDFPQSDAIDISWRYKTGYERLQNHGLDVIALWENDDWYAPDYLETMIKNWHEFGKPPIFGTNYTIYYHLKLKKYYTMYHEQRSSAMNTLIVPNLSIQWPGNMADPYTDLHLWMVQKFKGLVFKPKKIISVGMKHGQGMVGGFGHIDQLDRYINPDNGFLQNTLDEESFNFYSNLQIP